MVWGTFEFISFGKIFTMRISNKIHTILKIILFSFIQIALTSCSTSYYWAETLDEATLNDSWATYQGFYAHENSITISRQEFKKRVKTATLQNMTSEQFVRLNIENHRLNEYFTAKNAEDAYPESDRPRKDKDIDSVNYFLSTTKAVSPITVAIMTDKNGKTRFIKLDGVHRMMAAHILKKNLCIMWVAL